ncbi:MULTISPECIES: hypothetical protein [unclassified Deinococcus]|uniref:hypothetical protein n=1 Tax=unclassified Deinococcus TaxID=2623546 RepID=UPI001E4DA821
MRFLPEASALRSLMLALTLGSLPGAVASAQTATPAAPPSTGFKLPSDYLNRFGSAQFVASTTDGFGVRYLPLPLDRDVRFTLLKAPTYWDYGLTAQFGSLSAALGRFYNVPKAELTSAPGSGLQWSALVQGGASHSHATVGYATQVWEGRVRFLNNVGVAQQGDVTAAYTQTEVSGGYSRAYGKVNTGLYSTVRMYAFPTQGKAQGSADVTAVIGVPLAAGLNLDASHFERFAVGQTAIGDFGFGRAQSSNASLTYRLPPAEGFGLGAVRVRATRDWLGKSATADADVAFRIDGLPALMGGSVGYEWYETNASANKWRFALVALPR